MGRMVNRPYNFPGLAPIFDAPPLRQRTASTFLQVATRLPLQEFPADPAAARWLNGVVFRDPLQGIAVPAVDDQIPLFSDRGGCIDEDGVQGDTTTEWCPDEFFFPTHRFDIELLRSTMPGHPPVGRAAVETYTSSWLAYVLENADHDADEGGYGLNAAVNDYASRNVVSSPRAISFVVSALEQWMTNYEQGRKLGNRSYTIVMTPQMLVTAVAEDVASYNAELGYFVTALGNPILADAGITGRQVNSTYSATQETVYAVPEIFYAVSDIIEHDAVDGVPGTNRRRDEAYRWGLVAFDPSMVICGYATREELVVETP